MSVTGEWKIISLHFEAADRQIFSQSANRMPASKSIISNSPYLTPPKKMDQSPRQGPLLCAFPERQLPQGSRKLTLLLG